MSILNPDDRLRALRIIHETQSDEHDGPGNYSPGTSKVRVTIGGTSDSGQVQHDRLFVEKAPPSVLDELRDAGYSLAARDEGVELRM